MKKIHLIKALCGATITLITSLAHAVTVDFTGSLGVVYVDNGSATYSGTSIGHSFSGSIIYGGSDTDASSVDVTAPISADYLFTGLPYGGEFSDGTTTTNTIGANSQVGIGNNDGMGDDAVIINDLYGPGSTTAATIADTWGVDSFNSTYNFGLTLYSLDTSLYSGLDFQSKPPALNATDFALFYIEEVDSQDNTIYLATGIISSVSTVPLPGAAWLLGSGLLGLIGIARRRRAA
jgi:hypothetical protein